MFKSFNREYNPVYVNYKYILVNSLWLILSFSGLSQKTQKKFLKIINYLALPEKGETSLRSSLRWIKDGPLLSNES